MMTQPNCNVFCTIRWQEFYYISILCLSKAFTFLNFTQLWDQWNCARRLAIHFPHLALNRSICKVISESYSSISFSLYVNFDTSYIRNWDPQDRFMYKTNFVLIITIFIMYESNPFSWIPKIFFLTILWLPPHSFLTIFLHFSITVQYMDILRVHVWLYLLCHCSIYICHCLRFSFCKEVFLDWVYHVIF